MSLIGTVQLDLKYILYNCSPGDLKKFNLNFPNSCIISIFTEAFWAVIVCPSILRLKHLTIKCQHCFIYILNHLQHLNIHFEITIEIRE